MKDNINGEVQTKKALTLGEIRVIPIALGIALQIEEREKRNVRIIE
jgi:hypothetical protein